MTKYILVIAVMLGVVFGYFRPENSISVAYKPYNQTSQDLSQVERIFLNHEPRQAYQLYKETYLVLDNPILTHNLSHFVGEYLYKNMGMDGLAVCDEIFDYGCFHGFYGRAFSSEGVELAIDAQLACQKIAIPQAYGSCIHGIGHGLVAYFGYQLDHLKQALTMCDKLEGDLGQKGCYNGSFMEYNTRVMQGGAEQIRKLENQNYFDPCILLDNKDHRLACFLEIPSWWASNSLPLAQYESICGQITAQEEKTTCLRGVGRMNSVLNDYDTSKVAKFCETFNLTEREICVKSAGELLVANNSLNALDICDTMKGEGVERCRLYLDNYKCGGLGICQK